MQMMILGLHEFEAADATCTCTFLDGPHAAGKFDAHLEASGRSWHVAGQPVEVGLRRIVEHCEREGPYDGAFGFSQGTCMLALLSDLGEWRRCGGSDRAFPPWRYLILGCGTDDLLGSVEEGRSSTQLLELPSAHIIGKRDAIRNSSLALSRRFASPLIIEHDEGHAIPMSLTAPGNPQREAVQRFVREQH